MDDLDEYFDNVLYFAQPDGGRQEPTPTLRWQAWWQRTAAAWADAADPVLRLAAGQGFVIGREQALDLGVTRARARWLVHRGRWQAAHAGVLCPFDPRRDAPWTDSPATTDDDWTLGRRRHAVAATGAALRNPAHVVSGRSGAVLHGLPTFREPDAPVLTAAPVTTLGRRGAVHARGAALQPADVQEWFGTAATTTARTIVDLARLDRWDGVIAADAALHNGCVTEAELRATAGRARGWPGVRQARAIVEFADGRAESPLESLTRLRLHDDGFPTPEPQFEIFLPGRKRPYRVDFIWHDKRLILEADGRIKYSDDEARWREKGRELELRRLGYRVERVRWSDIVGNWARTRRWLWAMFAT